METGVDAFTGTERFAVIEQLGAGSMCVVYKVLDQRHGDIVALKTLRHLDSSSLYRLKQEFRALSAYDHPNLVSFYELVYTEDAWFVTMELVAGVDFLTWVRGPDARKFQSSTSSAGFAKTATIGRTGTATWADMRFSHSAPAGAAASKDGATTVFKEIPDGELPDIMRLRAGLRQLAEGVATLHEAGRLHRDLKPSNVLVTDAGRVVILDFGLVAEVDQDYTEGTLHQNIAGSAAYMSPEQSVGKPLTPASDWYAVGVMLYESLTGVWPYSGHLYHILSAKQEVDPPAPSTLLPGVPPDLDALCMALLSRNPDRRPDANSILRALHSRRPVVGLDRASPRSRFSFREPQMAQLTEAMQVARWGRCVVALVRGPEGIGKTALCREFIKKTKADGVLTLKGRCYEWETLPYKALDGVMDNLTRALRRLDHRDVARFASDELPYLAHIFPVLRRVDVLQLDKPVDIDQYDEDGLAELGFNGFLHLLSELTETQPVCIFIDDAHWGDTRSARILAAIFPLIRDLPVLFLLAHRPDPRNAFFHELRGALGEVEVRTVDVDPLTMEESAALAALLLGASRHDDRVATIALESAGVPLHIREFVRQHTMREEASQLTAEDEINEVVVSEVRGLPDKPSLLLNLVAIADRPLSTATVLNAARMGAGDVVEALNTLSAHHLINTGNPTVGDTIEIAGERLRDYVLAQMPDVVSADLHLSLAQAIEVDQRYDPEALVHHYVGAGRPEKAGVVAWLAAKHALDAHNTHDAVWLLERAIELGEWSHGERRSMQALLGRSLAILGSGRRAAEAFALAASDAPPDKQAELRLLAVEQLLFAGHVPEASDLLNPLLRDAGHREVPGHTMAWTLTKARRAALWWRGDSFEPRAEILVSSEDLQQIDVVWLAAAGFGLLDPAIGESFQALHLQVSLDVGEPTRVHRARALELPYLTLRSGPGSWKSAYAALQTATEDPLGRALATLSAAVCHAMDGNWRDAIRFAETAEQTGPGITSWQRLLAQELQARGHLILGNLPTVAELYRPVRRQLANSQNLLFHTVFTCGVGAILRMAEDDATHGLTEVLDVLERLPGDGALVPHVHAAVARALLELYIDETQAAWDHLDAQWARLKVLENALDPVLRAELLLTRARCALAQARAGVEREPMKKEAASMSAQLRKLPAHLHGMADLIDATLLTHSEASQAARALQQAAYALGEANFTLLAAAATRMLGIERDEEDGSSLRQDSEDWLLAQGVHDPATFCAALAPGF